MAKTIIQKLFSRDDGLLGQAVITFLARAGSTGVAFVMNIAIARALGANDAGIFFLSLTVVMAASVFTRFGMDNALMRFVSPLWEQKQFQNVLGVSLQGLGIVGGIGLMVTVLLYSVADFLAIDVFKEPKASAVFHMMAFAVLPFSLVFVFSGILKAVRLPALASVIEAGVIPFLVTVTMQIALFFGSKADLDMAVSSYFMATILGMLSGLYFFMKRIPKISQPTIMPFRELFNSGHPLMWVAGLNFATTWSSSLFLGVFSDASSVGLYNVAHRTAILISFVLIVVNSVTVPRFAVLYSQNKLIELERLAVKSALLTSLVAFPVFVVVWFLPEQILSIFGKEFSGAATLLLIVATGQFVNVFTGSVGHLLVMTGNERLMRNNMLFTAGLSLVLNVLMVVRFGAVGAAITTSVCLATQNIISAWFVYRKLGIRTIPGWAFVNRRWPSV